MTRRKVTVKHYLGVDPGKNGGLCVVDSNGSALECTRMPDGTARIVDWLQQTRERYPNLVMVAELAQAT